MPAPEPQSPCRTSRSAAARMSGMASGRDLPRRALSRAKYTSAIDNGAHRSLVVLGARTSSPTWASSCRPRSRSARGVAVYQRNSPASSRALGQREIVAGALGNHPRNSSISRIAVIVGPSVRQRRYPPEVDVGADL